MTNRATKFYDFALTGNGSQVILAEGSYYKILSSTGAVEVQRDGGSAASPLLAGQGERESEFKRLTIRDRSGAGNVGVLIVSDGQFIDDRITGEVSTIDGGKARTLAGNAFIYAVAAGPSVGNLSQAQLWNPAGSGRNLILKAFSLGANAAGLMRSGFQNTAIATLAVPAAVSKLSNGAVGLGQVRTAVPAASSVANPSLSFYVLANTMLPVQMQEQIVIVPGTGFTVESTGVNVQIICNFEWTEESQ